MVTINVRPHLLHRKSIQFDNQPRNVQAYVERNNPQWNRVTLYIRPTFHLLKWADRLVHMNIKDGRAIKSQCLKALKGLVDMLTYSSSTKFDFN